MFCKLLACKNLKTQEWFKFSNLKLKLQCTPTAMLASLTEVECTKKILKASAQKFTYIILAVK
jgi:hypothetical protein